MNIPTRYLKETEWQAYSRRWDFRAREALQGSVPSYLRLKRGMDIFISLSVLLLIGIWLIPLLAVLVRIESKGLPFFSQQRTGINGQTFTCYKIRTMRKNEDAHRKQATHDDERITRMGKFLRLSSLDEFPQFINVLKGDMSLVGPRPHMLAHTEFYESTIPHYSLRHRVKPGLTGLAQISGFRGPTKEIKDMENRVNSDLYYIAHRNLSMDLRILGATVHEVWQSIKKFKS